MRAQRLGRAANWAALAVVVLMLLAAFAPLPAPITQIVAALGGVLAAAVVLTWLTVGWLKRPRRPLWILGIAWLLVAALGCWMVGYALALRGNPARFADGRVDATPFGYGAWFGVLVLVAGGWQLRWLAGVRREAA
ncbi:hypothetical protein CGZ94_02685 [Enemella evansiae]|uniref:Transmembrane protein n=1 Tax=Enemella evansiae TaxID=2016499 RepID=A0A255GPP7_9ACTN|nr:hypothetical protein [Enemella evansiae]OYO16938.1 hypothetical protein BI335_09270 [Enemella evansiae]OYO17800.1 hypothetical protein CGZ94_02685 [Enemella evansiae]